MGLILWLLFIAIGIFQFWLAWQGIDYHWGVWPAAAVIFGSLAFRFMLPVSVGSYFGAVDVMGWDWWVGVLVAAPGLIFMIPMVLAEMADSIATRRR